MNFNTLVQPSCRFSIAALSVRPLKMFKLFGHQQSAAPYKLTATQSIAQLELTHCLDKAMRTTSSGETR
jgi:hypothetical protein